MTEPDAPSMLPLEESPWLAMYETLAGMIAPHEEVVDLGCGTGRFLELLRRNGHYSALTGVDWSPAALDEALRYFGGNVKEPSLRLEDLTEWTPDPDRAGDTVYVCSEVLEHLEDDSGLVERIPFGHRFLLSVPNFDSQAHVRYFTDLGDVQDRYNDLLEIRSWHKVDAGGWRCFHVVGAVRR
jgi:trans-aconitate methyltransferase